jgi:predicted PurR-regulated permease PerM
LEGLRGIDGDKKADPNTAMSFIRQQTRVGSTEATGAAKGSSREEALHRDNADTGEIDDPLVVAADKVIESEDPLLTTEVQEVAAQASEENPFGVPGLPLSERSPLRIGFSAGIGLLLAAAVGVTVIFASRVLILLLVAAIVATGLEPVVAWLCRHGFRRGVAVAAVVVTLIGLFGAFLAQVVPVVTSEASHFIHQLPTFLHDLQKKNTELGRLNLKYHLQDKAKKLSTAKLAGGAIHLGGIVVSAVAAVLVVLVLVVYFLADFPTLKRALYRMAPRSRRPRVGLIGDEILSRVGGYVLGNVLTSIVAIILNYILLRILGVPYALVLSVFVGLADLVPLVGSLIGGLAVALVAFASVSLTAAIITVGFHLIYRAFEDYWLNPRVMRHTVQVKPVVTIVAVLLGGSLLGLVGALIAVPVAAAIQLFLTEVVFPSQDTT